MLLIRLRDQSVLIAIESLIALLWIYWRDVVLIDIIVIVVLLVCFIITPIKAYIDDVLSAILEHFRFLLIFAIIRVGAITAITAIVMFAEGDLSVSRRWCVVIGGGWLWTSWFLPLFALLFLITHFVADLYLLRGRLISLLLKLIRGSIPLPDLPLQARLLSLPLLSLKQHLLDWLLLFSFTPFHWVIR